MIGSFRVERQGAGGKIGFDHVGDDGARFGKIERCRVIGQASLFVLQRTDEFAKRQCAGGIEEQWLWAIDKLTRVRRCPVSPFAWDCN